MYVTVHDIHLQQLLVYKLIMKMAHKNDCNWNAYRYSYIHVHMSYMIV